MLRIIGLVCPEFSTALSYFIGHLGQKNFEKTHPTDKQHGSQCTKQSIDAAILKLLTMETAQAGMRTIAMTQYDKKTVLTGYTDKTQTYMHKKQEYQRAYSQ